MNPKFYTTKIHIHILDIWKTYLIKWPKYFDMISSIYNAYFKALFLFFWDCNSIAKTGLVKKVVFSYPVCSSEHMPSHILDASLHHWKQYYPFIFCHGGTVKFASRTYMYCIIHSRWKSYFCISKLTFPTTAAKMKHLSVWDLKSANAATHWSRMTAKAFHVQIHSFYP